MMRDEDRVDLDHFVSRAVMKASGAGRAVLLWKNDQTGELATTWADDAHEGEGWTCIGRAGPKPNEP